MAIQSKSYAPQDSQARISKQGFLEVHHASPSEDAVYSGDSSRRVQFNRSPAWNSIFATTSRAVFQPATLLLVLLAEGHLTRRFRAMLGRIALLAVPIRKCSDMKIVSQYREQARCA
jgi:hypothetical protein